MSLTDHRTMGMERLLAQRVAQGLPPTVTDRATIAKVAALALKSAKAPRKGVDHDAA